MEDMWAPQSEAPGGGWQFRLEISACNVINTGHGSNKRRSYHPENDIKCPRWQPTGHFGFCTWQKVQKCSASQHVEYIRVNGEHGSHLKCDNLPTTKQQVKMGSERQTPVALIAQCCCYFRFSPAPGSAGHTGGCLLWWQLTVIPVQHQFETFKIFQIPPPFLKLYPTLVKEQFLLCHFLPASVFSFLSFNYTELLWNEATTHNIWQQYSGCAQKCPC